MPTLTGQVEFVNPPAEGKKTGSIKLHDGRIIGVFPDKLSLFTQGRTYEIEYSEREWQGKTYMTAKSAKPLDGFPPNNSRPASGGPKESAFVRPATPGTDAERMFVCSLTNAFIAAGHVDLKRESVSATVQMLRAAWRETFGNPQQSAEVNDEIPY